MGLTAQLEVDKYDVYTVVNLLHDTFARRILERAKMYTPVDTGAMQASWESDRENVHTSSVYLPNDNEGAKWDLPGVGKADWLLRGTGKYGPLEKPYCGKRIEPVTDFKEPIRIKPMVWRTREGVCVRKLCVQGINPRRIHGADGAYDFEEDLKRAVREGVGDAIQELRQ